ncbi:MAG: C-terminal binding protein, partial [Thaumarchaeota archaeon]|nr:C-terminal binding protein [Nitrososphaerota archaeon]
ADGIIVSVAPLKRDVVSNLERARAIVCYGVGYDNVDVKAATEKGILVCNVPDFMTYEVAEHTMALILSLVRKIPWADKFARTSEWKKNGIRSWNNFRPLSYLDGKVAGIVGFGRIGRQVAELLKAFHVTVIAFDPYVPQEVAQKMDVELVDLPTLMKKSDIVSVNAFLSEETFHLIDEEELNMMKESAIIVNTSRGKLINNEALVKVLKAKKIAGAGLDVLEMEPAEPNSPLLLLDNVVITPHIAGMSEKASLNSRRLASEEMVRILVGSSPRNPINKEVLKKN